MTNPDSLHAVAAGRQDTKTIIIDKVRKVPQLLGVVHKLIEENKSLRFILTGSSPRKLKRSGVDLLGGRSVIKKCILLQLPNLKINFKSKTLLNTV